MKSRLSWKEWAPHHRVAQLCTQCPLCLTIAQTLDNADPTVKTQWWKDIVFMLASLTAFDDTAPHLSFAACSTFLLATSSTRRKLPFPDFQVHLQATLGSKPVRDMLLLPLLMVTREVLLFSAPALPSLCGGWEDESVPLPMDREVESNNTSLGGNLSQPSAGKVSHTPEAPISLSHPAKLQHLTWTHFM